MDRWVGDVPLCDRFRRLYDLSENKMAIVAQMFGLGWDAGGEAWKWQRRIWAWVEECRILLLTVMLQIDTKDVWWWTLDPVAGYTVSGVYRTLILLGRPPLTMYLRYSYGGRMFR